MELIRISWGKITVKNTGNPGNHITDVAYPKSLELHEKISEQKRQIFESAQDFALFRRKSQIIEGLLLDVKNNSDTIFGHIWE